MQTHFRLALATAWANLGLLGALGSAAATEPFDPNGNVGRTNYDTLPFQQSVYYACWECSVGLEPAQLFFSANAASPYLNATLMASARAAAAAQEASSVIPSGGAQRWEDTY